MLCRACQSMPARRDSEYCGACLRASTKDVAEGLTAFVTDDLGPGVIAGVSVQGEPESEMERARR